MEKIINVWVNGSEITQSSAYGGIQGENLSRKLRIYFDDEWEKYGKQIFFFDDNMSNGTLGVLEGKLNEKGQIEYYEVSIPGIALKEGGSFTYVIEGYLNIGTEEEPVSERQLCVKKTLKLKDAPSTQEIKNEAEPQKADFLEMAAQVMENLYDSAAPYIPQIGETQTLESGQLATVETELSEVSAKAKTVTFKFGIPKGDKGEKGETGPQGEAGPQGEQGIQGEKGDSGVWIGSEEPPEGYSVWIDPDGGGENYLTEDEIMELLGNLNLSPFAYSIRTTTNEIGSRDLLITDTAGKTILSMSFSEVDGVTVMTVSNTQGQSVEINMNDGANLSEENISDIANLVKDKIPFNDYVKTVNGSAPDENGNVSISATLAAPEVVESVENMTDTTKQYVLNGYLYAYMKVTTPAHKEPLFTNYFNIDNVRLNSFTTENGIVTAENYNDTDSLYKFDPNGYIEIGTSIPFTPEDINKEHILRVVNLGYGIMANPNLIQPWIGEYHAPVSGVKIRYMSDKADGTYCETDGGLGEQWLKIPIGVGGDSTNKNNWNERPYLNGDTDKITGIRVSLRARISESGPLTKEDLISRNIIITFDQEIAYEDVPEEIKYVWTNTGQKYGNDYSAEIEDLTKRVTEIENTDSSNTLLSVSHPFIKSINHQGFRLDGATPNTLQAYKDSKKFGFEYVECDVRLTANEEIPKKDGVAILHHDYFVETDSGNIEISQTSYDTLIGIKPTIPTFENFILLCRNLGLHPYIEMKTKVSTAEAESLFNICKRYNMHKNCTWISFYPIALQNMKLADPKARLGYVISSETVNRTDSNLIVSGQTYIQTATALKTDDNDVFIDANYEIVDSDMVTDCIENNLPLEVWTVNTIDAATKLNPYVSGFTSDYIVIGKEFLKNNLK